MLCDKLGYYSPVTNLHHSVIWILPHWSDC